MQSAAQSWVVWELTGSESALGVVVMLRARIISLFTMLTFGLQPISSIVIGYSAEVLGAQTAILINAFLNGLRQWVLKPLVEPILSGKEKMRGKG